MAQLKAIRKRPQSYEGYLKIDEILELQKPVSSPPQHDELLFIIAHQTYELWFKLMLAELEVAVSSMGTGDASRASRAMGRVVAVLEVLTQQLRVLETIRPQDFAMFRDSLRPASGFQSVQFRELEFISGQKDERFLELHKDDIGARSILESRLNAPDLWDAFTALLKKRGFLDPKATRASVRKQVRAVTESYRDQASADIGTLADALLEYDEAFWLWRNHHVGMVERLIGRNVGTGSTYVAETLGQQSFRRSGVAYLKTTLRRRFFPVLWAAKTKMGREKD